MLISNSWLAQSLGGLIESGTPTDWPTVYALVPQNGGREIIRKECKRELSTQVEAADLRKAVFTCSGIISGVLAQTTLDTNGNWRPWSYLRRGQNFSHRTTLDKGVAITFDGTTILPNPFQTELEIDEAAAKFLQPHYPVPPNSNIHEMEIVRAGRKTKQTLCAPKNAIQIDLQNISSSERIVAGLKQTFDCPSFHPQRVNPFTKKAQGIDWHYSLGNWHWRRFAPGGQKIDQEAVEDESLAHFDDFAKPPLPFSTEEDLIQKLIQNFFEPSPSIDALVSPYGDAYQRRFTPQQCRFQPMTATGSEHFAMGQCTFRPGEVFEIELKREFTRTQQGNAITYETSEWSYTLDSPTEENVASGIVEGGRLILVEEDGVPALLPYPDEPELEEALQTRYNNRLGNRYFPKTIALRGGILFLHGNRSGSSPPRPGESASEEAISQHNEAAKVSEQNELDLGANGLMGSANLELYPLAIFNSEVGGPFLLGGLEGGYAGSYEGGRLYLIEAQFGVGLSFKELLRLNSPFDFSARLLFWRGGKTSEADVLPSYSVWGLPQVGACVTRGSWSGCVDYSRNEIEDGSRLNFLKFGLGYNLSLDQRPEVEIVR